VRSVVCKHTPLRAHARAQTVQRDFGEAQKEVQYLTNKLSEARGDYTLMASRLALRTPRPSQPKMPPWELVGGACSCGTRDWCDRGGTVCVCTSTCACSIVVW